jgi:hypothetical protein
MKAKKPARSKLGLVLSAIFLTMIIAALGVLIWLFLNKETDFFTFEVQDVAQTNIDVNTPEPSETEIVEWKVPASQPRYMTIASVGMNKVRVESLGVKAGTNQMDDPANPWNVGWYNKSAKPGAKGAGVYDCHTFFGVSRGLCNKLGQLKLNSNIVIERGDGKIFTYKTIEVSNMSVAEANEYMNVLFTVPAGAQEVISIITCSGNFDSASQTSDQRTIVRAILTK